MAISNAVMKRLMELIGGDLEQRTALVAEALKKPRVADTLLEVVGAYASPTNEISSETQPELMADIVEDMMGSLQKGRVKDLVVASILRNLHSVKLVAYAPRFSVSLFANAIDCDVIEPVFAVFTLTEENQGEPQHAFTFTVSSQYGFRFHNLMTENAKQSKADIKTALTEVMSRIETPKAKKAAKKITNTKKQKVATRLHA